ncbi:MAG: MFS transporter [Acidobacteria bacterium]|nr:MFS transporter [Acidobacteriota bacterium]MCW5969919.1 MFS transporter [Blastocatellales bacterium]
MVQSPTTGTNSDIEVQARAWAVIGASAVGLFLHFGSLLVNTFGIFIKPLGDNFGWSRGEVSLAFTLASLAALASMPVVGHLTDRIGPRRLILFSMTMFGALFASLALLSLHLWHLYILFIVMGLLGPGTSAVPHASLIARWFDRRRGLAMGLAMGGTGLGGIIWPPAAQALIDAFGWRLSYALLGALVLGGGVAVMLFFLKEPEPGAADAQKPATVLTGLNRREALGGETFWIMIAAFFIVSASVQACQIHLAPMLSDRGMTAASAAAVVSIFGAASLAARVSTGYLLDRFFAPRVAIFGFMVIVLGLLMLLAGAKDAAAYAAAFLVGLGYGAETATVPYLVSRYFGLRSFGELYSYLFLTVPLGGVTGPALAGLGFDRTGSYTAALAICAASTLLAGALLLRLKTYPAFAISNEEMI